MSDVVLEKLSQLLKADETLPDCIYLYGQKSVGKSLCLKKFFDNNRSWLNSVVVHTAECYTSKILFETIINAFRDHEPSEDNDYSPYCRLDSIEDFLLELGELNNEKSYVLAVEEAEKLRDMEFNLLPVFMKLQEYTGLNITCLLVSHLAFEKIDASANVIKIHVPDHTKADIVSILALNYEGIRKKIALGIEKATELKDTEKKRQLAIVETLDVEFYKQFLNAFLNVFYKACRDITELRFISNKCFVSYYTPVLREEIAPNDVTNLWRNISKVLRASLQTGHMRIGNLSAMEMNQKLTEESSVEPVKENSLRKFAQTLELPYYAKFLLLASFLASHNEAKFDKRLFMKHHGKERKRQQKAKVTEKLNIQIGPKSFTIDRLLAIFYAILDEQLGLTCNLMAQLSTLVDLNFLTFSSGESNIMEGSSRLQSTIGLDFAINIGKVVGFDTKRFLSDFR